MTRPDTATLITAIIGLAVILALTAWSLWHGAGRIARDETALRAALKAHDQDIDALTREADLPPDEFAAAFREWQDRQ